MNSRRRAARRVAVALLLLVVAGAAASAQSPAPGASPTPTPSQEKQFFRNILRDQRAIWTSPLHLDRDDVRRLAPLGLATAVLLATDQETDEFGHDRTRTNVSKDVSFGGSIYSTAGIATAFYVAGRATGNARARETGLLAGEALIDAGVVSSVLKNISQRQRPDHDEGQGEFFESGHSFPSGHATSAWALATVIANEYRGRRLVQVGAYGAAAAVSMSRYSGRNHFLSDVLVGSAIGYGIGRYVFKTHHDKSLDSQEDDTAAGARSGRDF
jgi:membrane-associated phospholipid phosphatase